MKIKGQPLTQEQFEKSIGKLFALLEQKAGKKDIEKLTKTIERKADKADINKLTEILASKANTKDLNKLVTKDAMDENMQLIAAAFEKVATKEDIKDFVTKQDLETILQDYPTKDYLDTKIKESLAPYATKEDIHRMLIGAIERIEDSIIETQKNQAKRITALERA